MSQYSPPPLRVQEVSYVGDGAAVHSVVIPFKPKFFMLIDVEGNTNTIVFIGPSSVGGSNSGGGASSGKASAPTWITGNTIDVGTASGINGDTAFTCNFLGEHYILVLLG